MVLAFPKIYYFPTVLSSRHAFACLFERMSEYLNQLETSFSNVKEIAITLFQLSESEQVILSGDEKSMD